MGSHLAIKEMGNASANLVLRESNVMLAKMDTMAFFRTVLLVQLIGFGQQQKKNVTIQAPNMCHIIKQKRNVQACFLN